MDPVSVFPAIAAIAAAAATAYIFAMKFGEPPIGERFATIDGLRGFLAFFVFLHHSCIWYFYLKSGKWESPPSSLYIHFGQSSVALFFMITGFLFYSKVIEGRSKKIDWERLYVSRFLRLVPLYFFVIFIMFLLVFNISSWTINEPISKLIIGMLKWLSFTVFGGPDLNGIESTYIIVAGVTWSLPYEWLFYFSLPLLALIVGVKPPLIYICLSVIYLLFAARHPSIHYLSFVGGVAAALLVRLDFIRKFAAGNVSSFVAILCLIATVVAFPFGYGLIPLFLLTVFFVLIASGNSLFGFLLHPASRTLGEYAYGIYLIHGVVLFIAFYFVLGLPQARALSALQYWAVVVGITPLLISLCFLTYTFIEHPAMQKTTSLTIWFRSFFLGRS
jgi:peptidoglycan/LPS O-acetylase OafA/YrhL